MRTEGTNMEKEHRIKKTNWKCTGWLETWQSCLPWREGLNCVSHASHSQQLPAFPCCVTVMADVLSLCRMWSFHLKSNHLSRRGKVWKVLLSAWVFLGKQEEAEVSEEAVEGWKPHPYPATSSPAILLSRRTNPAGICTISVWAGVRGHRF